MSSFRKVVVVPEEKLKSLQECASLQREAIERLLRISLLLARIDGYNESLQIRSGSGQFINDSNILDLIEKLETEEQTLVGEDDFIHLLKEAKVPLSLIKNENIKSKLSSLYTDDLSHLQPLREVPLQPNIVDYTSETQSRHPLLNEQRIETVPSVPDPHWTYNDFFVPPTPLRRERRTDETIQWRQM
jgi:hypothetical protein